MSKILNKQLTNAQSVTINQFGQSNIIGSLDLTMNPNPSFACRYYHASEEIVPGEGVILVDRGASDTPGAPIVTKRSADANAIFGVNIFDAKNASKASGKMIQIATSGMVITMEASAAIARGASVALVLATPGQVVTRTTETILGKALDKASASGDLVRILIA